ncbi:MAG: hypothetical protein R3246_12440, partial [Acidimicrobiia bacterium]|nr:hypothetical protein [Acidimicrobiia bacterium]
GHEPERQLGAAPWNDSLQVTGYPPGDVLTGRVFASQAGPLLLEFDAATDGDGNLFSDLGGEFGFDLQPGHYVHAQNLEARATTTIDLTFDVFDIDADLLSGEGPPGETVFVGGGNDVTGFGSEIPIPPDGRWTYNTMVLDGVDLDDSMGAQVQWFDDLGDFTYADPRIPQLGVNPFNDAIALNQWSPGHTVTVTITEFDGGPLVDQFDITTDAFGNGWSDLRNERGIDLMPGNWIAATNDELRTTVADDLTFDTFDLATSDLGGMAPEGAVVSVGGGNEASGFGGETTAVAGDRWAYNPLAAEGVALQPNMGAEVQLFHGDDTYTFAWPVIPALGVSDSQDRIRLENFPPNADVAVQVFEFDGGPLFFDGVFVTDDSGFADRNLFDFGDFGLEPGNVVNATVNGLDTGVEVVPLAFTIFDPVADAIGGTGPFDGARIDFGGGNEFEGFGGSTTVAPDLSWFVDLAADQGFDLTPDMGGDARHPDPGSFNYNFAEPRRPSFEVSAHDNWIGGGEWTPNDLVAITIWDNGGGWLGAFDVPTDPAGNFWLDLNPEGIDIEVDFYIEVLDPSGPLKGHTVEFIQWNVLDPAADLIGGVADPNDDVQFDVGDPSGGIDGFT